MSWYGNLAGIGEMSKEEFEKLKLETSKTNLDDLLVSRIMNI